MKRNHILSFLLCGLMLLTAAAAADTISFEGTVIAGATCEVYAPIGGTVGCVPVTAGQRVKAGDVLAEVITTKVYAAQSGTVTGILAQPGDSADTITEKYGAVMYIEGESVYTITASVQNAYNTAQNKLVHVGESVNLAGYTDSSRTGFGRITSVDGMNFDVEVQSGEFMPGESVCVYRGEIKAVNRIGRGTLSRRNPLSVCGSGSIVSFAVKDGDTVERGDLLFETLDGSFDGAAVIGNQILSPVSGIVASVSTEPGVLLEKGSVAAVIYPEGALRIKGQIPESDLIFTAEGDTVEIELIRNQDEDTFFTGKIAMISFIPAQSTDSDSASGETAFDIYIDFTPDPQTRCGMNAIISTTEPET